jgi:histidine transport system permease protein
VIYILQHYGRAFLYSDGYHVTGLAMTLWLLVLSCGIGFCLSLPLAIARNARDPFIRIPVWLYTFIFRGTPVYVQLLLIYSGIYGLQFVRHTPPLNEFFRQGFNCAVLAFALNTLAYTTEIFAGAIRDTAHGEVDAGLSLGMSRALLYRRIIIPAALRRALPAYSNEVILMLHATSLAFTATVPDILKIANDAYSATYDPFDSFGLAALIYLAVSFTLVACFRKAEWRLLAHLRT